MVLRLTFLLFIFGLVPGVRSNHNVSAADGRFGNDNIVVTDGQVEEWLQRWQGRMGLDDWKVTVEIVRIWQLDPHTLGHIRWSKSSRKATIKILNPLDYRIPKERILDDMELSVVHELVHLQLSVLPLDKSTRAVEEKVVAQLANTMIALDRRSSAPQLSQAMPAGR
ncbi:MAG: hypothetical protein WD696_21400 [Bryobacteraceae bacterium]